MYTLIFNEPLLVLPLHVKYTTEASVLSRQMYETKQKVALIFAYSTLREQYATMDKTSYFQKGCINT